MLDATPPARALARRRRNRLDAMDPVRTQFEQLLSLARCAQATNFGAAHDFVGVGDIDAYRKRVPLRSYEQFAEQWWRAPFPHLRGVAWPGEIPYFAKSSGTSGGPTKFIPVSREMMRANRRAALDVLGFHLASRPNSRILAGRNLMLGGSAALETLAPGVAAGDLSGIAAADMPCCARRRAYPPRDLALIGDWNRKMDLMAAGSVAQNITGLAGTPSWMLLFLERVAALRGGARLSDIWPQLELVAHGGVGFAPYRQIFAEHLAGSRAETREVYAASEGFFAIADRGDGEGLRLVLDNGLFYEFVRPGDLNAANPDRRWVGDAEIGVEYALVVTSNAGLWSYIVGDTVTLIDRTPPRLLVTGRIGWSLSIVGEHLIGHELDAGIAAAGREVGAHVADYVAAALPPSAEDARGGHVFVVEISGAVDAAAFARALDADLSARNEDYAAHRAGDVGMRPPSVRFVNNGVFAGWMASRGKLGGQNKAPRVIADPALLQSLLDFADRRVE